jgi:hypothetical protein
MVSTSGVPDGTESPGKSNRIPGEPCALKGARTVCAVRRVMIFLLQAGGTGEMFLGYWHT